MKNQRGDTLFWRAALAWGGLNYRWRSLSSPEAYLEYQTHFPPEAWEGYVRDIMDLSSLLGVADLTVAEVAGRLSGAVTFYWEASSWPAR